MLSLRVAEGAGQGLMYLSWRVKEGITEWVSLGRENALEGGTGEATSQQIF